MAEMHPYNQFESDRRLSEDGYDARSYVVADSDARFTRLEELAFENQRKIGFLRTKQKKIMGGPMIQMSEEDYGPPWLRPLVKASIFIPCGIHGDSNKSECNMYCLDCMA
ncbi:hypothetical protein QJS10_CPB18g01001 [Acorus calamus]|uniref:Uncharacterized protein n=1 Tax=Acorus calamus TaxID=4465 RepID=A0AAV9CQ12_ACOCL|nr:hypothetical protein QJS10_CPB18g01001 [Acorus calamus]